MREGAVEITKRPFPTIVPAVTRESAAEPESLVESTPHARDREGAVCAVIVTFRPNVDELKDTLWRATQEAGRVIVIDNTPEPEGQQRVRDAITAILNSDPNGLLKERIFWNQVGRNVGLSRAYNLAIQKAGELNASFILLLDQDSKLVPGAVRTLLDRYEEACNLRRAGSISCSNIESVRVNVGLEPIIAQLREKNLGRMYKTGRLARVENLREIQTFTNSGTLIPLERVRAVGQFDESLFVDAIDYDFSFRLRAQGFHLFVADDAFILHSQGTGLHREVLGLPIELRSYSAQRSYHIVHDTWTFARRWFRQYPRSVAAILLTQVQGTLGILVLVPGRIERARFVLKALRDLRGDGHIDAPSDSRHTPPWSGP
jgi:rhamnosyltransferase